MGSAPLDTNKATLVQRGFTIVELLIVIVVIAILAGISIVAYGGVRERAERSAMASDMTQLQRDISLAAVADGSEIAIRAPIAYTTERGRVPLAEPIEDGHEITLYVVFDTDGTTSSSWNMISRLEPHERDTNAFHLQTTESGTTSIRAKLSTPGQSRLSNFQSGVRNLAGRNIGWMAAREGAMGYGFNQVNVHGTRTLTAHDGWNFGEVFLNSSSNTPGVAALVFDEYHDEATRRGVIAWLNKQHDIDRLSL